MNIDEFEWTKRLVYGDQEFGWNPNEKIRADHASSQAQLPAIAISDFMASGAGRYVDPSDFKVVNDFFAWEGLSLSPFNAGETYALNDVFLELKIVGREKHFYLDNYFTDAFSADYIERSYIFGNTRFDLVDATFHVDATGNHYITDISVKPTGDNFGFQSSNFPATLANELLLSAYDPYGLIPMVPGTTSDDLKINFVGPPVTLGPYTIANGGYDSVKFFADASNSLTQISSLLEVSGVLSTYAVGLNTGTGYLGSINADPLFRYQDPDGRKIIYGSPNDDDLSPIDAERDYEVNRHCQVNFRRLNGATGGTSCRHFEGIAIPKVSGIGSGMSV